MPTQESLINIAEPLVAEYLKYLQAHPDGMEIQYRTPFENLINGVRFDGLEILAIQEDHSKKVEIEGTPDFTVYQNYHDSTSKLVGYIECKKPSYKLEKLVESEQIKKYSNNCENIILTNYHRFILLQKGKIQHDFELSNDTIIIQKFINLLCDFYGYEYQYIKTKKTLVSTLAAQSFYYSVALREFISDKKNEEDNFYIKFNGLFKDYQNSINYHYELEDFCDVYSQSLVYGLLLSRLDKEEDLNEKDLNYLKNIPAEYRLLYEFLTRAYESRELPSTIKSALINIGKNINLINVEAIKKEFAQTNNDKDNIAVYLYEDFLSQYDKFRGTENRKEGGVYYTPSEAADFITKSVNYLLKTRFNLQHGFSSDNVKVLDFACGTGTFLHSVFEQMIPEKNDDLQKSTLKQKILKDIYGFELLFTPYIIAHTFLTRFLKEKNIVLDNEKKERLGVYLTNTLDISQHSISEYLPNLRREYEKSRAIKDNEDILAIIGNPPYFRGKSQANKSVIDAELKKYKEGLNLRNIQPLEDIYIKFIRFAEWKIAKSGHGVVGIITNNSFLDGIIHHQMRKHLYETFDEIYILNLHGNARKNEPDKNIFDIMLGVSIVFFVKHKKPATKKIVKYFSTLENNILKRQEKFDFLENKTLDSINWKEINPQKTKYFWFIDKNFSHQKEYNKFWKITDIFNEYSSGTTTAQDKKYISYKNFDTETNKKIMYRPFDKRYIDYDVKKIQRARYDTMKHFIKGENIGLCLTNGTFNKKKFNYIFVSETMSEGSFFGFRSYLAPLYFYNGVEHADMLPLEWEGEGLKFANFTQNFIDNYLRHCGLDPQSPQKGNSDLCRNDGWQPTPEEILAYIYAVLHSKIYREKYIEFLKTDFPAVPMTTNAEIFEKYAKLGQQLIDFHLLRTDVASKDVASTDVARNVHTDNEIRVNFDFEGDFVIEKIEHDGKTLTLTGLQNPVRVVRIAGVTNEIYNFEIGSYKPIEKWLKYRIKDKVTLSLSDLNHLKNMIISIKNTISIMNEIENLGESYLE